MTEVLAASPEAVGAVARALAEGAVVGLPTDTVYGLAARLDRPAALEAVFSLKGRPAGLALPVLVAGPDQLEAVVASWPPSAAALAEAFWPGPLTLVVPGRLEVAQAVGGDGSTVGVRVPDHGFVQDLCRTSGPLAVTSANPHGEPPCTEATQVARRLPGSGAASVAVVVDGGRCEAQPSAVVDCTVEPPVPRRHGPLSWAHVEAALGRLDA